MLRAAVVVVVQVREQAQVQAQVLVWVLVGVVLRFRRASIRVERCSLRVVKFFFLKRPRIRERGWASRLQL